MKPKLVAFISVLALLISIVALFMPISSNNQGIDSASLEKIMFPK